MHSYRPTAHGIMTHGIILSMCSYRVEAEYLVLMLNTSEYIIHVLKVQA